MAFARRDIRRPHNMRQFPTSIIIQRVGSKVEVLVAHVDVVIENRHLRVGMVLTPVAGQRSSSINEFSTFLKVAHWPQPVIVERVGIKSGLAVFQYHILKGLHHLVVTIIIAIVTGQRECIALIHTHMAESLKRVTLFEKVCTITEETGPVMLEFHMPIEHLGIIVTPSVVAQFVWMNQINAFLIRCLIASRTRFALSLFSLLRTIRCWLWYSCCIQNHQAKETQKHHWDASVPTCLFYVEIFYPQF